MSSIDFGVAEPLVFHSLRVERFRGFNEVQEIPLYASAVVISGANGRGKTSLFDAIQWLVLGRIPRLEELRFRRNEEHIVNRYAPKGSKAIVVAKLKGHVSNEWVTATRTGNYRGSILEVSLNGNIKVGKEAELFLRKELGASTTEDYVFERDFLTAALLQQDLVRSFLSTSPPAERYEILSRLLGLSRVNEFVDRLSDSTKYFGEKVSQAEKEVDTALQMAEKSSEETREGEARIELAPGLAEAANNLKQGIMNAGLDFLLRKNQGAKEQEFNTILNNIRHYRQKIQHLDEVIDTLTSHLNRMPTTNFDAIKARADKTKRKLDAEESLLETNRKAEKELLGALEETKSRTDKIQRLAAAAIPLLDSQCPVCSQKIDPEHVRTHLESLLIDQPQLIQQQKSLEEAHDIVSTRRMKISQLQDEYDKTINEMVSMESWQAHTKTLHKELKEIAKDLESLDFPTPIPEVTSIQPWLSSLTGWSLNCSTVLKRLEELANRAVAAHSVSKESVPIERLKRDLEYAQKHLKKKREELKEAQTALDHRKMIIEVATKKGTEVVAEAFKELDPLVQDLFCRLAPHPTFDRLSFSHEVYYKRGSSIPEAIDQQTNIRVSPSLGFSSAQANVAALCYFIALAFATSEADFGFVLLDDPLQSLDDVNNLGFSDLCRFLRREKQLIIATHEDRLSSLLVRKLTPRDEAIRTLSLNFRSWNRWGPNIEYELIESCHTTPVLSELS